MTRTTSRFARIPVGMPRPPAGRRPPDGADRALDQRSPALTGTRSPAATVLESRSPTKSGGPSGLVYARSAPVSARDAWICLGCCPSYSTPRGLTAWQGLQDPCTASVRLPGRPNARFCPLFPAKTVQKPYKTVHKPYIPVQIPYTPARGPTPAPVRRRGAWRKHFGGDAYRPLPAAGTSTLIFFRSGAQNAAPVVRIGLPEIAPKSDRFRTKVVHMSSKKPRITTKYTPTNTVHPSRHPAKGRIREQNTHKNPVICDGTTRSTICLLTLVNSSGAGLVTLVSSSGVGFRTPVNTHR